jgi:hypothetical protein
MSNLLVRYIKLLVREAVKDARVPNQLIDPTDTESEKGSEEEKGNAENVQEFSGCGAIAGYTAPLGANPDEMGRKKNAPKHKKNAWK